METDVRRKKLLRRKKALKEKSDGKRNFLFFKADTTTRIRILPVDKNEEFAKEVIQFYLGGEIKGVISPHTFGERCAIMEKYNELIASDDEDDKELASKLKPKNKYVIPVIKYKSNKGGEVDDKFGVKLAMITNSQYQQLIDYYLDDEQGDFTDIKKGYDIKITRTGSGLTDTEYSMVPCKPTPLSKKYSNKVYDIEELLKKDIPSYKETISTLNKFLGLEEEGDNPKKKKKLLKKKKNKGSDI